MKRPYDESKGRRVSKCIKLYSWEWFKLEQLGMQSSAYGIEVALRMLSELEDTAPDQYEAARKRARGIIE